MTTELAPTARNSVVHRLAERYGVTPATFHKTVKSTVCPGGITDEQFFAFLMVADVHKLNPLTKEIYAFPSKGGGITPIVGVDGWIRMMNEHPQFNGVDFEHISEDGRLVGIKTIIFRKDRDRPTCITEWMAECLGNTEPWKRWPARQLRHKSLIQCIRVAFGFAGIYDPDEASRIEEAKMVEATVRDGPKKGGVEALAEFVGITEPELVNDDREADPDPLPPMGEPTEEANEWFEE